MVKNSLTRKVFREMNINVADDSPYWQGPTLLAWGASSVAELSREIDSELKDAKKGPLYKDKVTMKGAIADGQPVTLDQAMKMPTRAEAIARVVTLALSPGSRLLGQIIGPAGSVASQIKTSRTRKSAAAERRRRTRTPSARRLAESEQFRASPGRFDAAPRRHEKTITQPRCPLQQH